MMKKKSGPTIDKPYYDFVAGEEKASKMSDEALLHSMRDALQAAEAMRGVSERSENWYRDEAMTYGKELAR